MRIGFLGGSFNPIHLGHLVLGEAAYAASGLDRVLFIPALGPPHKPDSELAPASHRLRMVELAVAGNPHFEASNIEFTRPVPSFTIDTVTALRRRYGNEATFYLVIGGDSVNELPTWKDARRLAESCQFVVGTRPDAPAPDEESLKRALGEQGAQKVLSGITPIPAIGISSSDIRARVRAGRPIRYLVPRAVEQYIEAMSLYRSPRR